MIVCILKFILVSWLEREKTLFIAGMNVHCVFTISQHKFLDSEDLSLFEFISESNMSFFLCARLCALNKDDSEEMHGWKDVV